MKLTGAIVSLIFVTTMIASTLSASPVPDKSPPAKVSSGNPRSIELNEQGVKAMQKKDMSYAESLFRQSLVSDPGNITAAFNLAGVYISEKKEEAAISLLSDLTVRYTKDPGLFVRLGDAYFSSKNVTLALKNYESAWQLASDYPKLGVKLATTYTMNNQIEQAEKVLLKTVESDQKDSLALNNLSSLYLANKKPHEAISVAKKSLQLKSSPEAYLALGTAYEILKDNKNALISYKKGMALGSKAEGLAEKIEGLEKAVS